MAEHTKQYVYFGISGREVKIGLAHDPPNRIADMRTARPNIKLFGCIPGSRETERHLHQCFSKDRISGEWFYFTPEVEAAFRELLNNNNEATRILVLDNLGCLFTGVKENDAAEWEKILPWLLEMRRHKIAVIIIHHTGVDPSRMRGTTKREDPAAFSIRLEDKKEDFSVPGARFVTRFRKYRGREAILDHEWDFKPDGNRVLVTFKEASRADVVLQWVRDGLITCSEIAREMGVSNGTVSKIATRLISQGKLTKNNRGYEVVE